MSFTILQSLGDFCDDTLIIYELKDGVRHQLNSLHQRKSALIMVADEHLQIVLSSCDRLFLQTAVGFLAHITFQGI